MKEVEGILAQCIDDINSGKASLDGCLACHPDMANELKPLLEVALSIEEPADIHPSDAFKLKARVNLMEYIHSSQTGNGAMRSSRRAGVGRGWLMGWARAVAIVVAVVLVISVAGTAYASQSSLPGDTLYSVKLGTEQLQRIITFDGAAEVELELKFADTRLDELEELASMPADQTAASIDSDGKILTMSITSITVNESKTLYPAQQRERIEIAIAGYERNLNLAIAKAASLEDSEKSLEMIASAILSHLGRLDVIEDEAAESAQGAISSCREMAINGHINALQNLAELDPVGATEINLRAMECRLDRAEVEAERGNRKGVEDALQEYEKLRRFGEEISNSPKIRGQDTQVISEINARATSGHLESLSSIYGNLPQEMKVAVEQAMGVAIEEQRQAAQGLQQQGAPGDIPTEPTLTNDIRGDVKKDVQGSGGDKGFHDRLQCSVELTIS